MERLLNNNFASYVAQVKKSADEEEKTAINAEIFKVLSDLQKVNKRTGADVFYHFLNKIFDRDL